MPQLELDVAHKQYGPFVEVIRATGPMAKANPFRFSTKYQDDETDLLYYGYRYYNASTGRWLSRDPIEENGGLNMYGFVLNSPANIADSDGRGYFWTNPSSQNGVPGQVSMTLFTDTTTGDSSSAYQLGWSWLTGSSDSSRHFSGHDQMAEQMRNSPEAAEARKRLKSELKSGCHVGLSEPFSRGLGGESRLSYVVGFASDMVNNPARAFLGSFSGRATVEKCFACCAVVKFELRDGQKGWKSATHLPPPYGYPPPGQPENPALFETWYAPLGWGITWGLQMHNDRSPTLPSSILPNNAFGKYGHNIDVTIDWKEILCP